MRSYFTCIIILFSAAILLLSPGCYDQGDDPDFPLYSYTEPVVNPPDIFQVVYNISYTGDRPAYITFEDDAVWLVENLGDSRINYWAQNDTASLLIPSSDTLALKAGYTYLFIANNNNYSDFNNFFTMFTKLPLEYEDFEPKF